MDIAFVSDVMYPWVKGGAQKRTYEIAERLAKNHEITIYTMKWWPDNQKIHEKNEVVFKSISSPKKLYEGDRRSITEAISFAISTLKIKNDHDVIDFNVFPYLHCWTGKLKSLRKKNFVITWHEVWSNYWYTYLGKKGFFGKVIEKLTTKLPNKIIAVSQKTQKDLKALGAESTLVPNGINYKRIQEIGEADEGFDVVFVGRLIPEKNIDTLIKAIGKEELSLGIIGDGPQREKLEALAKEKQFNVEFLGELEYEELIGVVKSSKIFALPSSREGFGITALEAMACGKPVLTVAEEKNAARYLVDDSRGLVVPLDEYDLKNGALKLLGEDLSKYEDSTKKFAKKYDWDRVVDEALGAYRELLE